MTVFVILLVSVQVSALDTSKPVTQDVFKPFEDHYIGEVTWSSWKNPVDSDCAYKLQKASTVNNSIRAIDVSDWIGAEKVDQRTFKYNLGVEETVSTSPAWRIIWSCGYYQNDTGTLGGVEVSSLTYKTQSGFSEALILPEAGTSAYQRALSVIKSAGFFIGTDLGKNAVSSLGNTAWDVVVEIGNIINIPIAGIIEVVALLIRSLFEILTWIIFFPFKILKWVYDYKTYWYVFFVMLEAVICVASYERRDPTNSILNFMSYNVVILVGGTKLMMELSKRAIEFSFGLLSKVFLK